MAERRLTEEQIRNQHVPPTVSSASFGRASSTRLGARGGGGSDAVAELTGYCYNIAKCLFYLCVCFFFFLSRSLYMNVAHFFFFLSKNRQAR